MADIAKRAGVHTTTVSMALRNHRNLPSQTIERIKKLANEMGYRPDPALQALTAYRHQKKIPTINATIAYLTNWGTEFGWSDHTAHVQFFNGAKKHAKRLGYKLDHFWLRDRGLSSKRLNEILLSRGIGGLLFASCPPDSELAWNLEWSQFAGVKIDYHPSDIPFHSVTNDQQSIIRMAFRKILEKGYRRVGLVLPRLWDDYVRNAWTIGYLASQQQVKSRERIPALIYDVERTPLMVDGDLRVSRARFEKWYMKYAPEVIISYHPYVMPVFEEMVLQPGEDIGYVDLHVDELDGKMAGMINQCEQVSRAALELLTAQIRQNSLGFPPVPMRTLVGGTWQEGETLKDRL